MNGNDRFLNVNDAHLRVTGGNVHASSFNLDQISITTTSTTSSTIDFLNETKAFNTRSNVEIGTANLFVDTTTSNVGIRTSSPEYALDVHGPANVSVLTANTVTGFDGTLFLGSHLLPTQHQQFDIGSAEKKIRHLFLSDNSLWIGDETKISFVDQKLKFLKRNKSIVPSGTEDLGGNATDALAHAKISDPDLTNINQMKLEHWLAYTKTLTGGADKDIKDIFTTATSNYESVTASEAFKEHDDTNIYSLNKLRLGSAAAAGATLDVVGTIKATSDLTVNTNTFHVDATNSRVGVGTSSPGYLLDVQSTSDAADMSMARIYSDANANGVSSTGLRIEKGTGYGGIVKGFISQGVGSGLSLHTLNGGTDVQAMTIMHSGNVGVGTSTPDGPLHISKSAPYNGDTGPGILFTRYSNTYGGCIWNESNNNIDGLYFNAFTNSAVSNEYGGTPDMVINSNGRVGVGTNNPSFPLQVIGKHGFDESGYWARYRVGTGHEQGTTRIYFRDFSDTNNVNLIVDNLSSNNDASDDRIKTDEVLVENATQTLLKLKPQTYTKDIFEFDELTSEEYSNTETLTDGYVFSPTHDRWRKRRFAGRPRKETGLIIQDIWYDAPELRHIIRLADDAEPTEERPETEDIQQDPDYDSLGWGQDASHLMYQQIIPYLIKSNQELHARIQALENAS